METAEYDEEKSHEDTSKMAPSVNAQKLDANQLAAKILHLRMKGRLCWRMETSLLMNLGMKREGSQSGIR
uniref:Uncharacterized protein n=1 Tax=Aegilops tauschii subsp. strangulata TaxID=200361 RepID=A0A453NGH8_AEGTS